MAEWLRKLVIAAVDTGYPDPIHIPHVLYSVAEYRRWRQEQGQPRQWLFDMAVSYWSHSQGGGCVGKGMLDGLNQMSTFTNPKHLHYHVLGFIATYWSPYDILYRWCIRPLHPVRLLCFAMDSIDASTTTFALIDKGRKLHPENKVVPYLIGILLLHTGAMCRWLDAKCRGQSAKVFYAEPGPGVTKGAALTSLWLYFGRGQHRDKALVLLTALWLALDLLDETVGFNVFEHLHKLLISMLVAVERHGRLGPQKLTN